MRSAPARAAHASRQLTVSPALFVTLPGVIVVLVYAVSEGGYYPRTWYPGALFVAGLLVVALLSLPAGKIPRRTATAAALLFAFAGWSYLSIAWADQQGPAWDGANRTALYAGIFALFALWRLRSGDVRLLLATFVFGVSALGLVELLRATDDPGRFEAGRFSEPVGYQNGNVGLWSIALWVALGLAARRASGPLLRGSTLAAAVFLAGCALLGQSRGWLFVLPLVVLVFLVVSPLRLRAALTLGGAALAVLLAARPLLDVYDAYGEGDAAGGAALDEALPRLVLVALVAGLAAAAGALVERRTHVSEATSRRAGIALLAVAALAAGVGLGLFIAREGSPTAKLSEAWDEFKDAPQPRATGEARFSQTLGSNRYDFWRVAWGNFKRNPLTGVGSENFQQDYLQRADSDERPRHPHSVELQTLSQTGIVGGLLLGGALVAALMAALPALRGPPSRAGLAAAALMGFAYWLIHGSLDWFWEIPALGGSAFALLGIAVSLGRPGGEPEPERGPPLVRGRVPAAVLVLATLLMAYSFGAPWLAARHVSRAADIWPEEPRAAFDHLDSASGLNPLSAYPKLVHGSIALELELYDVAAREFAAALERDPRDPYATLELGMIRWRMGQREEGIALLRRARRLSPRDYIVEDVLEAMRAGELVDIDDVNRRLLERARERTL